MDMGMKDGMEKKEPSFKCPSCGEVLKVETSGDDMSEDSSMHMKKKSKMNAGTMPMGDLKSKINPMNPDANY